MVVPVGSKSALGQRIGLLAVAVLCACGDSTHTVGTLASSRAPLPAAGSAAQAGRSGAGTSSTPAGSGAASGSVGQPDGGLDAASPPDPIGMLGDAAFSCGGDATPAVRRRLDLFLMVDINLFTTIGTVITEGLNNAFLQAGRGVSEYVDDPRAAGTGVGIGYFPPPLALPGTSFQCDPETYAQPAAEIGLLPDNATRIKRSFPAVPLALGSPTLPALEGALLHARSRFQGLTYKQAVVLITDRVSDFSCLSSPGEIVDTASRFANGNPPIPTYVVALSSPRLESALSNLIRFEQLDAVAAEGNTSRAYAVDLDDQADSLVDVLLRIQADAEPCQYEVDSVVRADPQATALGTVGTGPGVAPIPLPRLGSEAECGAGYYFDDPDNPAWATLCRDTCTALKASVRSVVWIGECEVP